jgi:hypothetical protein
MQRGSFLAARSFLPVGEVISLANCGQRETFLDCGKSPRAAACVQQPEGIEVLSFRFGMIDP